MALGSPDRSCLLLLPSLAPFTAPTIVGLEELTGGRVEVLQLEVVGALQSHPKALRMPLLPPQHVLREAARACADISKVQKVNVPVLHQWLLQRQVEDKETGDTDDSVKKRKENSGRGGQKQPISKCDPELPPGPQHPVYFSSVTSALWSLLTQNINTFPTTRPTQAPDESISVPIRVVFSCPRFFPHHTVPILYPGKQSIADRSTKTQSNLPTALEQSQARVQKPDH